LDEEGAVEAVKLAEDESASDLFDRIRMEVITGKTQSDRKVPDGGLAVVDLVAWLLEKQVFKNCDDVEVSVGQFLLELHVVASPASGFVDQSCMEEPLNHGDEDAEVLRTAERLVYGWPSKQAEPTGAVSDGRFVKSFPLDFPMGVGDLYDSLRLLKVSAAEWVQHLLRYWTGHFVGGMRGQRVVWAIVNTLLLEEARSRGFGIYRNVMRRVGYGLEGGGVLTKARLREMLNDEDQARVLVNQLMNVGRDVRSTPMQ